MLTNVIIEGVQEDSPLEHIRQLTQKFKFLEWKVTFSMDENGTLKPCLKWIDMLLRFLDNDAQKLIASIDKNVARMYATGEMTFLDQFGTICLDFNQDDISKVHICSIIRKAERYDIQLLTNLSGNKTELHDTIMHEINDIHEYRVILEDDFFDNMTAVTENILSGERLDVRQNDLCSRLKQLHSKSNDFFLVIPLEQGKLNDIERLHSLIKLCYENKNHVFTYV